MCHASAEQAACESSAVRESSMYPQLPAVALFVMHLSEQPGTGQVRVHVHACTSQPCIGQEHSQAPAAEFRSDGRTASEGADHEDMPSVSDIC